MPPRNQPEKLNLETLELDNYPIPALEKLIAEANKSIQRQQRRQVRAIKKQFEQMASGLGLTAAQVIEFNKKRQGTSIPGEPKYRNPEPPHQTWTGHGKRPRWYIEALEQYTPEEMEIQNNAD